MFSILMNLKKKGEYFSAVNGLSSDHLHSLVEIFLNTFVQGVSALHPEAAAASFDLKLIRVSIFSAQGIHSSKKEGIALG